MTTDNSVPMHIETDHSLRIKIIDSCGMTCTFCHNEGTPVTADNLGKTPGTFVPFGRTDRVSIYTPSNGVEFLAAPTEPDADYMDALIALRDALDIREAHLTGGEPTLHPALPQLIAGAAAVGLRVRMTSNGERGAPQMRACAEAGLEKINFSVFGTTPEELAAVQHARYRTPERAERKLAALSSSIEAAKAHGVQANANIVVPDHGHIKRVHRLLDEYAPQASVRLLNSLSHG